MIVLMVVVLVGLVLGLLIVSTSVGTVVIFYHTVLHINFLYFTRSIVVPVRAASVEILEFRQHIVSHRVQHFFFRADSIPLIVQLFLQVLNLLLRI